ncbi:hypothetical protein [Rufibacter roseus]|uniref:Uncharacterized protein n=1 Tax=Rufibacter roseus TaxID=1567108 RepID=A0ABW2DT67_9BACT|nr:hypothetical protein [Rufibacter roseus]
MTDQEFDILDELYFVTPYLELKEKLDLPDHELQEALRGLISMNYIKCLYPDQDTEVPFDPEHFTKEAEKYYFLATKAGLLNHNSK